MSVYEANFDGLIGPTHNYGGLSDGNRASATNAGLVASPRAAALQGLEKMKHLHEAGLWQGLLPPQQRPYLPALRRAGFIGTDKDICSQAWKNSPQLMKNCLSASSMWSANAATVSPSADTQDGKLHLTPANLSTMLHRSIEHPQTQRALETAFPFAQVHPALPEHGVFSDEGAANHVRLCGERGAQGVELFVYGREGYAPARAGFPARQSLEASQAVARLHSLDPARIVFALQSDAAIDAGAFHNDVVCVGAKETLFYHELAFADTPAVQDAIIQAANGLFTPRFIEVPQDECPMEDAIKAYLFNSMLVQMPGDDHLTLVAPLETKENAATKTYCDNLVKGNGSIGMVSYVDVRQSMRNGGGPACLRLRVTLTEAQWEQVNPGNRFSPELYEVLKTWINAHYREQLSPEDLRDPSLMEESFTALDALTQIMGLGPDFYPFQRG